MTPVSNTTMIAGGTSAGLIVAQWLVHPVWPPPDAVLTLAVAYSAPLWHLIGRAIYNKIATWAGEEASPPEGASK